MLSMCVSPVNNHLRTLSLYGDNFAYQVIHPDSVDSVREQGRYLDPDEDFPEDEPRPYFVIQKGVITDGYLTLSDGLEDETPVASHYAAFLVLDKTKLIVDPDAGEPFFSLPDNPADALVAIVKVTDYGPSAIARI